MSSFVLVVEGLEALEDIENLDRRIIVRARQAINSTLRKTRTAIDRDIRQQVAFKARYLGSRLRISQFATDHSLQGTITGRDRPTSLARFATSRKKGGARVQVAPGITKQMNRAFLMQLKGGNEGLAIRLKPGETIKNKKYMRKVNQGLYLLYGPSVNQVFRGVAEDESDNIAVELQQEFTRLMELD